jgi:hypothetical protein
MVIETLIAIILFLVCYPYVRWFIKRVVFSFKLKRFCKKNGIKIHKNSPFWVFGITKRTKCDFYVETNDTVYSVKLTENVIRKGHLSIIDATHFTFTNYRFLFIPYIGYWRQAKHKNFPEYDFHYRFKDEFYIKTVIPMMLMLPIPAQITFYDNKSRVSLYNGALIYDSFVFYSGSGFFEMLKKDK